MSSGPYLHPLKPYCQIRSLGRVVHWLQTSIFSLDRLRLFGDQGSFTSQCFEWVSWQIKFLSKIWAVPLFAKISNIDKIFLLNEKLFFLRRMLWLTLITFLFLHNGRRPLLFFGRCKDDVNMLIESCVVLPSSSTLGSVVYSMCWSVRWGHLLLLVNA